MITKSEPTGPLPTDPSIDYLAAFVDGEGCVYWHKAKQAYQGCPVISITNTFLPILTPYLRRFGGAIRHHQEVKGWQRTQWSWYVMGARARSAMRTLMPFLVEKQEQARLLLHAAEQLPMSRMAILLEVRRLKRIDFSFEKGKTFLREEIRRVAAYAAASVPVATPEVAP